MGGRWSRKGRAGVEFCDHGTLPTRHPGRSAGVHGAANHPLEARVSRKRLSGPRNKSGVTRWVGPVSR
ncbi:Adenosylhomocysteinase [Sphingomonas sp. AX6]|nr:Adenosylhomocysteinase [Sphingomonas sp. AX6]